MHKLRKLLIVVVAISLLGVGGYWLSTPSQKKDKTRQLAAAQREKSLQARQPKPVELTEASLPHQVQKRGFRSSESCSECHQDQFQSWHGTFHRTMTQVASPETVVAPFEGVQLTSRGRTYYLSREDEKFFVTMADPDWEAGAQANGIDLEQVNPPIAKLPVVMTTGSHHMQGYWVPSKRPNMLRQVPLVYLIHDKRWVPREDIFIEPPDSARHLIVWNDNCIVCHAVDGTPNFDTRRMTVDTEVAELGISCEACHGPGEAHIAFQRNVISNQGKGDVSIATNPSEDPVINPATVDHKISSEICGQCHSYFLPHDQERFGEVGYSYVAGGDLSESHALVSYEIAKKYQNEMAMSVFWNDGTCRVSGREFTALIDSPCYENGSMSCVSCHSMHDSDPVNQLARDMNTNDACLQCHASMANRIEEHTHHSADSSGSLCYNCHMPYTTYGLLKALRSHKVQTPRISGHEDSDQPNACNLCHLDQTRGWAAEKLTEWYSQPAADLDKDDQETSAALLWLLRGDAVQRAIAAWHMNWQPALDVSGDDWQTPFLAELLDDDYAAVRYLAGKGLARSEHFGELNYDYIATVRNRRSVKEQLLKRWEEREQTSWGEKARRLLLDADGKTMTEEVREYLRQQNKRPIILPE